MKFVKLSLLVALFLPLSPLLAQSSAPPSQSAPAAAAATAPPAQTPEAIPAMPAGEAKSAPASDEERIARKVRHTLVMQSRYSIYDWLAFRVNGSTVELLGSVYSGGLKDSAADAVSQVDGVDKVLNHIHLLSPSPEDDRIRHQVADAIYSSGPLLSYAWSAMPTIHIVVNGGQVWLEGEVDNQKDKDTAAQRVNTVSGVLQVTNNLRIEQD